MSRSLDSGGEQPDDGSMNDRLSRLEKLAEENSVRLTTLERDVAIIRSNYVTKEDLYKALYTAINGQTWRLVTFVCGFGTALVAATYFIATHAGH
jgi:hypothetical protein